MSVKKAIVDKVIERLQTIEALNPRLPTCPTPAFKNPFREVTEEELPCFKVALLRGKTDRINNAIEYRWTDQLIVAYIAQGNDDGTLEDDLYEAAELMAALLIGDENNSADEDSLHHLVSDLVLTDWDMDLKNGAVGTGAIVLKFDLTYHQKYVMEFDDLEGLDITIKHTEAGEDTEAIAKVTINLSDL